ncbi:YcxB family protein [Hymenobacter guriensis]|uniref:YcxB family protein n=1 Tax=Hymenobacter guriensis TaxID=2793065 RepID=A0ABS0KXE3_9BACT|nr:YcxB family protein [Hymenobacter guriensis]MBG8552013.1 YcxB family protein [Hymenobacter guriensis]
MNDFSITTRLTTNEYVKIMFIGLYRKPAFILATILGFYYVTTISLDYLNIIDWYNNTPVFEILCGAFLLLAPTLITFISIRQFLSNPNFQNNITYSFSDNGFTCQGFTFKSEFVWQHITKQKELGKFLILYHNKKFGNFIDKTKLTAEQLNYIKSKVISKSK